MKKTRILVTGSSGFIGSRFVSLASGDFEIIPFLHEKGKSINNAESVFSIFSEKKFDAVLHLASKTHIDACEKDKNSRLKNSTWDINVNGTRNIAAACRKFNKYLLFLSTECVFDGKKRWYHESDKTNPVNWYGDTKLNAEKIIMKSCSRYAILRSTLAFGHPGGFNTDLFSFLYGSLSKGIKVRAVNDQLLSLTFIDDLVNAITVILKNQPHGIYHYAGNRSISPFGFAKKIAVKLKSKKYLEPVSLKQYFGNKAHLRLKQAMLSSAKIEKEFNLTPSNIESGILKAFSAV